MMSDAMQDDMMEIIIHDTENGSNRTTRNNTPSHHFNSSHLIALAFTIIFIIGGNIILMLQVPEAGMIGTSKRTIHRRNTSASGMKSASASASADITLTRPQCLSIEKDLDELVSSNKEVYIIMPPKVAGSSIIQFVGACMRMESNFKGAPNGTNKLRKDSSDFLKHQLNLPSVIATHFEKDREEEMLFDLIQQTTKDSLIIYLHREETDRLMSAIRHVVENRLCTPPDGRWGTPPRYKDAVTVSIADDGTATECTVNESDMVQALREGLCEMGGAAYKSLTCSNYDAIEENAPNFLFVDYRRADDLQTIVAKHRCPGLLDEIPFHANDSADRDLKAYIRLDGDDGGDGGGVSGDDGGGVGGAPTDGNDYRKVPIDEWVKAKRSLLEWTLKLKDYVSCQGKTRMMENTLFNCDGGVLQLSSASQTFM